MTALVAAPTGLGKRRNERTMSSRSTDLGKDGASRSHARVPVRSLGCQWAFPSRQVPCMEQAASGTLQLICSSVR